MERNPCLLYKWLDNGVQLIWQDLLNRQIKTTVSVSAYMVLHVYT